LLNNGSIAREGDGDVSVWPSDGASGDGQRVLNIELSSPFGQAHFETAADEVADFLARTYEAVPAGAETSHVDIDAELTDLLRQA